MSLSLFLSLRISCQALWPGLDRFSRGWRGRDDVKKHHRSCTAAPSLSLSLPRERERWGEGRMKKGGSSCPAKIARRAQSNGRGIHFLIALGLLLLQLQKGKDLGARAGHCSAQARQTRYWAELSAISSGICA